VLKTQICVTRPQCVNKNRQLYDEMMEEEINSLDISVEKNGKRNCMSKVLREKGMM